MGFSDICDNKHKMYTVDYPSTCLVHLKETFNACLDPKFCYSFVQLMIVVTNSN